MFSQEVLTPKDFTLRALYITKVLNQFTFTALHYPYFDFVSSHMQWFSRWPVHVSPYYWDEYDDTWGCEGELVQDLGDIEGSERKILGREHFLRKHKDHQKAERWKGLKSGAGRFDEEEAMF